MKRLDDTRLTFSDVRVSANLIVMVKDFIMRRVRELPFAVAFLLSLCICQLPMCNLKFVKECIAFRHKPRTPC